MANVPADWVKAALKVTGHFEDSADPLGAVTGDFDGMGVSLGVLQWNIGSYSLQPMVAAVGKAHVLAVMPTYGAEFWRACNSNVATGLDICRGWQSNATLNSAARKELKAFTSSQPFVDQQVAKAGTVAQSAYAAAEKFAAADPGYAAITKPLFCWFFDLYTQNGGTKGLGYADVAAFIASNGKDGSDDVICAWLASRPQLMAGYRDAHLNADLWRNKVPDDRLSLFVFSYLRSQLSRPAYRADTMNRKATIAVQKGWVHRELHNLTAMLA